MPTIKDIAKMAGVSHGTVSNVLNGRGNVSAKKIKLVEEVAEKLGYQLNLQAKILKEGQTNNISIILPNITSEHYSHLYDGLFSQLNAKGYQVMLYLTHDSKELELQFLQQIAIKRDAAIITVSCLDSALPYYQLTKTAKDKIIFVYRKLAETKQFISLDFLAAGKDIAQTIIENKHYHIGLFSNSDNNTHSFMFKKGLVEQLKHAKYNFDLHDFATEPFETTYNLAFTFFNDLNHPCDAIVTTDIERAHYIRNACYFGSAKSCPPIYTLADNNFNCEDNIYQYHMNFGMLSQNIVNLIEDKSVEVIRNRGFISSSLTPTNIKYFTPDNKITVLILPSPATDALIKLLPHFKKQSGIDVDVIVQPFDEIYHILDQLEQHTHIDVIRVDMAGLPWFAKSTLKPLQQLELDIEYLFSHYAPQVIERFSYVNQIAYTIPFDPSIQMLFYRRDLFQDPLVKRYYYEKYRQHLTLPNTFEQLTQISQFFNQQYNPESPIKFGACVTLGNPEIIASEFLIRYYAQGGTVINDHNIQLNKPIALATLQEFAKFINSAQQLDATWWLESVKQFEQGNIAMLIMYMNLFAYGNHKNSLPNIGYATVPGHRPLFGGGSLGMSKYSNKNNQVAQFFNWIYSPEITEQMALLGGITARNDIFQNQKIINNHPWLKIVPDNYSNGIRENRFDHEQSLNLRYVETIIGLHIQKWLTEQSTGEQTVDNINAELLQKSSILIH